MSNLTLRTARRVVSLHNRIKEMGALGYIYAWICRIISFLRRRLLILLWYIFKWRPRLNRRTAEAFINNAVESDRAGADSNFRIDGRLVVRVAFHFNGGRLTYLMEMLHQLRELPFRQVYIALDTNSKKTGESLRAAKVDFVDEIVVHSELAEPYDLTWMHRSRLKAAINDFDFFVYAEDDLLITPASIELWYERLSALKAHGYLPGFLRVEQNRKGLLVSSDFHKPAGRENIVSIAGKPYLWTPYPYQAFWLYDKDTMKEFVDDPLYETGYPKYDVRARMAIGFNFKKNGDGWRSQHILPLTGKGLIDPRCFVFHMPSNYGRSIIPDGNGLGTIPVANLIEDMPA
jgi:hypothetical protein